MSYSGLDPLNDGTGLVDTEQDQVISFTITANSTTDLFITTVNYEITLHNPCKNSTYLSELVVATQEAYQDYVTQKTVEYTIGSGLLTIDYPVHIDGDHCGSRYYKLEH